MINLYPDGRLDNPEIRKKLLERGSEEDYVVSEDLADDIISQFWFEDFYNSFIAFPKNIEILKSYLKAFNQESFSRPDFYYYFFINILGSSYDEFIEPLRKLAIKFELAHSDKILKRDFEPLVRKLELSTTISEQFLKDKGLMIEEDSPEGLYLKWKHHTLTEYLASEEVLLQPNPVKYASSLMILEQEGITAFKPSWYGALRFLIESERGPEFSKWLLDLGENHPDNVDDQFSDHLLWSNPEKLSDEIKSRIFKLIYGRFQSIRLWLPPWSEKLIGKFVTKEHLKLLKEGISATEDTVETFVHRGNISAVIGSTLELSDVISDTEKEFWKEKLVEFANDENTNGVLQRRALEALAYYKEPELIPIVAGCFNHRDSLVREAFIQFCYKTAPNSTQTVDYLVKAIKGDMLIYGRYGLYEITDKEAVLSLLNHFINDSQFYSSFLKGESIFDKGPNEGDSIIVNNITSIADEAIINKLKHLVKRGFEKELMYRSEKSAFIRELAKFVQSRDPQFIFELLNEVNKDEKDSGFHLLYGYMELLPYLLDITNVEKFFTVASVLHRRGKDIAGSVIFGTRTMPGKEEVYKLAISKGLIPEVSEIVDNLVEDTQNQATYTEFLRLLEPEKGKYSPDIFGYYTKAFERIESLWSSLDKSRLTKLTTDSLKGIDPTKITVSFAKGRGSGEYKITQTASYFGDVLRTAKRLCPKVLTEYRQRIIDFIPYAYSEDQQTILDLVSDIKDQELEFVNSVYLDTDDDRRYLIPSSYIYLVGEYKKNGCNIVSPNKVLWSFIEDRQFPISDFDRRSALRTWGNFINALDQEDYEKLTSIFNTIEHSSGREMAEIANELLISVYRDNAAIDWRFEELRNRAAPFEDQRGQFNAHSVGPFEDELSSLKFAKPLIELKDPELLPNFLNILHFSLELANKSRSFGFWPYTTYLWNITIKYTVQLAARGSFIPFLEVLNWCQNNVFKGESRWLLGQLNNLRQEYVNAIGRHKLLQNE